MESLNWAELRHQLHQIAELSNQEKITAQKVTAILSQFKPDQIISNVGGYGILAVYDSHKAGPTTLIRAELDALPIVENQQLDYHSQHQGCAHKCGHDGHMTIVLSLAEQLNQHRPVNGRIILAFQSAEETGEGAAAMVEDPQFSSFLPDFAFALHNYPGMALGEVGIKSRTFNCASKGMIVHLQGATSHAAYPEHGNSPALAMCELIRLATELPAKQKEVCWCTVVHAKLGEVAFGTSPGEAVVMMTLRSETNETMAKLESELVEQVQQLTSTMNLTYQISFEDEFRATVNDDKAAQLVSAACNSNAIPCHQLDEPMRWSEDFGRFTEVAKHGALFVLGSGESTPQLHHPDYDFPDQLLGIGQKIFWDLIKKINGVQ